MKKPPSTKVMEIFSESASTPAVQRRGFLEQACGGDPELRAEVESLLSTQNRINGFLDAPTVRMPDSGAAADLPDPLERDRVVIGRYSIIQRIGEGGFGVVYCARQNHPIRREVALKIVKLGMDTRQIIARFESERQALALMDHTNIARILDAGATADGRPYFVMELVRGSPITEYCDTCRLTIQKRLELFTSVCHAVQHAHQKGIIHRDLKPSNILVTENEGGPVPKVIDFGIAKAMQPRPGEQTAFTELRHVIGTPQYMSPEQAGANSGDVDTRSDIYALGVLLYELLTGATPFDTKTLRDASYEQVHRIIREKEPPRPSARLTGMGAALAEVSGRRGTDGPKLVRSVAGELDWVVMKAVEKDRRRRYETASALAEDVQRYLANEPLLAGPPDTLYRMRKFARRHRRPMLAAAALALALLMGLAGTIFGLVRAKRDRDRAQVALSQAQQVSTFLADMLRSADPDRIQGKEVSVRSLLDRTAGKLDEGALKDQPLVEAQTRMAIGRAYDSLGLYTQAEPQVDRAFEIRQRLLGPEHRETLQAMSTLAWALSCTDHADRAEAIARAALVRQERSLGPEHPDLIATLVHLGLIQRGKRDVIGAEATLRRAVDLCHRGSASRDQTATALTNLAVSLLDEDDYEGAEPLFREALALDREGHGERYRNVPRNMSNIAAVLLARGDLKGAESYWRDALRIQRDMLPADHPDIAWTLRLLGKVRQAQGDLVEAEKFDRESLEMERRIFGREHPMVALVLEDLGLLLQLQGRRDEALSVRREEMNLLIAHETAALAANPRAAAHRGALGEFRLRRGEFLPARADLAEAARLDARNPRWLLLGACLDRYLDDSRGYHDDCNQILQQYGDSADPHIAAMVARECLLESPDVSQLPRVLGLMAKATSGRISGTSQSQLCKGLLEFRRGDFARAIPPLTRSHDSTSEPALRVTAGCYLALALRHQGNDSDAAIAFTSAMADYDKLPRVEDGDLGSDCDDWLVCQIARREAVAVLHPPGPTTHPAP